jgi:anti-anti-sigma factor
MTGGALDWTTLARPGARIAGPAGRVDETSATAFSDRLGHEVEAAAADGATRLIVDLAKVDYMSSRGLRGLTLAQRKAGELGVEIVLAQPNEIMREILSISRYDKVFKVADTIDRALAG